MKKISNSGSFIHNTGFYLIAILALLVVIAFLDWRFVPGLLILAATTFYNYRINIRRRREITRYVESMTFNVDSTSRETMLNFPMPLVAAELDGNIIWMNASFKQIFGSGNVIEKRAREISETLSENKEKGRDSGSAGELEHNGRTYNIIGNIVKMNAKTGQDRFIMLISFNDITDVRELRSRIVNEKATIGLIIIDNYDDLMQSMEDNGRPQMLAEIDKKIMQWTSFTSGIVKKFERDKYFILFEYKNLKIMEEKKFDILDVIKEINIGNRIPVTLSIGIGLNGNSFVENFQSAASSIDMALGRGGDHVVIKDGANYSFYGGKARELEKRTKVKARVVATALLELIESSSVIAIMGHENPDIDSMGASLGLFRIARNKGKEAYIVFNETNPAIESLVARIRKSNDYDGVFVKGSDISAKMDEKALLIVVDTHRPAFTLCPELLLLPAKKVVIDHHRKGSEFIQDAVLVYQETYASSTSELISELLQYTGERAELKPVEAEALFAGIVIDTNNFTFKAGVRTFEAASYLRRQGVDTISVRQLFQNDKETYISVSEVVRNSEIIDGNIALSVCPKGIGNSPLISAKAADELLSLSGIMAAFVLCDYNGVISISGRSLGDHNMQMILEKLGGGGHLTVAGAQLEGVTMDGAVAKLKTAIFNYIQSAGKEQ